MNDEHDLDPRQAAALAVLASGGSYQDAAAAAKVSSRTLLAWRRGHPGFIAAVNMVRTEARESVRVGIQAVVATALTTVRELLESETAPAAVKLRASEMVLRSAGAFDIEEIGPTDPNEIHRQLRAAADRRGVEDLIARLTS